MYQCPACRSPKDKDQINHYPDRKVLTVVYEAGCVMKLEAKNGKWTVILEQCVLMK